MSLLTGKVSDFLKIGVAAAGRGDRGRRVDRVRDLIARGADVNARTYKGQTALHCAARAGFVDIVFLLLEHGAKVDLRDDKGNTPLVAALRSRIKNKDKLREVVQVLTEAGAKLDE